MIKVYIVEDHEMYLEGLSLLLKKQENILVEGTALNAHSFLAAFPQLEADIILLDLHLPDMEEEQLLKTIRSIKPQQKIIYLTLVRGTRYIHKLRKHTIQGYILKNAPLTELVAALETVNNGGVYYSKEIDILGNDDFRTTITLEDRQTEEILSKREIEILRLICKEYSNAEIAEKLFLSVSTIETHRKNIIAKLGVNNTVGLVMYAIKNKLVD